MRRWLSRLRWAWTVREWPWSVPWSVVDQVGTTRPADHVFEDFRRLHGIATEPENRQPIPNPQPPERR